MIRALPFLLIFLFSCAGTSGPAPKEGRTLYSFTDVSGRFGLSREVKRLKNRIVTRSQLIDVKSKKTVEKSVTVSQLGTVKAGKSRVLTVRPLASDFTVWLEGKAHSTSLRLNPEKKSLSVSVDGSEPSIGGTSDVPFPKGRFFCFFSQIPECLYHSQLLQRAQKEKKRELEFQVVWDSFPFMADQYTGIGKRPFSRAVLKFDGPVKDRIRYVVELEGQIILYHFSKSYDLVKIAWIAQGLTVVPPGEEIPNEEQ